MTIPKKIAIITGGASGMGFAVSQALMRKGDWTVNILDINPDQGQKASQEISAIFYQVDITNYSVLASAFHDIFSAHQRIDFVFANAGVVEQPGFYTVHEPANSPPPPPSTNVIDINLNAVVYTSYLAQHYFRQTPRDNIGPRSLIITASCSGIYASPLVPTYAASKSGAVGWTRSIADIFWENDGIRVNAILPGPVRTALVPEEMLSIIPAECFSPIEKIFEVVLMFLDADGKETADGTKKDLFIGETVETFGEKHYFRKQHEYCDEAVGVMFRGRI